MGPLFLCNAFRKSKINETTTLSQVFLSQKSVKKKFQPFRKNHKYSSKQAFCKASNKSKNRNNFSNKGLIDLILFF